MKILICASTKSDKTSSRVWVRNLGTKDIRTQQIRICEMKVVRKIHDLMKKMKKEVGE